MGKGKALTDDEMMASLNQKPLTDDEMMAQLKHQQPQVNTQSGAFGRIASPQNQNPSDLEKLKGAISKFADSGVEALPMAGATMAGMAGGIPSLGVGAVSASGMGAVAGEAAKRMIRGVQSQGLNYFRPTWNNDNISRTSYDLGVAGIEGALGEKSGRLAGQVINAVKPAIKSGVSRVAEFTTGIPKEAYMQLINQPKEVLKHYTPQQVLDIARRTQEELSIRNALEQSSIQNARKTFAKNYGNNQVDTAPLIKQNAERNAQSLTNEEGVGAFTPQDEINLSDLERKGLTTKAVTYPAINDPSVIESKPKMAKRVVEHPITAPEFLGHETVKTQGPLQRLEPLNKNQYENIERFKPLPDQRRAVYGPEKQIRPEYSVYEPIAFEQRIANKTARELQQFSDQLSNEITTFENSRLPGGKDSRYQASLRRMNAAVKQRLHELSPELAQADAGYHQYANDVGSLSKLENDSQMESFVNNFYGKNKEAQRQAAQKIIPESIPTLKNMGASRAFSPTSETGSGGKLGSRANLGNYATVAGGAAAVADPAHSLIPLVIGGTLKTVTNPTVAKNVIGRASQLSGWLAQNPNLLKFMQSYGGQNAINSWLNQQQEER